MQTTCLNCNRVFDSKFCPDCGQKATVERLNVRVLMKEMLHSLTHIESGFLFTTGRFLVRPGKSALTYLSGKRKEYQKPVSYYLIWTGLFILIHNTIINNYHLHLAGTLTAHATAMEQANMLFRQHFALFIIPVILLSAILLYYLLAKPLYNFVEILIASLYGAGTYFMMLSISDFILGVVFKVNILSVPIFYWQTILSAFYNFWFSFDFFKRLHLRYFWLRLISVSLLVAIGGWAIMVYLPLAWLYFAVR